MYVRIVASLAAAMSMAAVTGVISLAQHHEHIFPGMILVACIGGVSSPLFCLGDKR